MALITPTTKEINDNIIAQLQASLNQTIPLLPKSFTRVLAKALAGVFILLYKYAGFMFLQIFVRTAAIEETEVNGVSLSPLLEWGRLIGVGDPSPGTNAELQVTVNVENQTGFLAANTQLINANNGVTYLSLNSVPLDAATVTLNIRAAADQNDGGGVGEIGNLETGDTVSFANPLPNVSQDATVAVVTTTGSDAETTAAYRQRVIDRFQKRPQGGAYADYELWGEEPSGILNVYPYTSDCPGQVDLYVEATPESSGSADGIPTVAQLQEVLDSVEADVNGLANRRPAGALVNTFAIVRSGFDVTVAGVSVPSDLGQVQADITAAVQEYFTAREPYIIGLSVPPRIDRITRTGVSGTVEDIVTAAGGVFSSVTVELNGVVTEAYSLGIGEKAKAQTVVFI